MKLSMAQVEEYLSRHFGEAVHVLTLTALDDDEISTVPNASNDDGVGKTDKRSNGSLKTFGYGEPILVTYKRQDTLNRAVFSTVAANHFGHEDRADRVAEIIRSYEIYNTLPQHVRALDIGILARGNNLQSLAGGGEFFLLTEHVRGKPYAQSL